MKTYYWLVKREFWENRGSFLWAPVVATGIFLLLNIMGIVTFEVFAANHNINIGGLNIDQLVHGMDANTLSNVGVGIDMAMMSAGSLVGFVTGIVVFFYCLGSLYDDRRDRSILFWKSLPISDRDTVFSKVISAAALAPAIATICGVIGAVGMLLLAMLVADMHGVHLGTLLGYAHPLRTLGIMIAIMPVNLVWALPSIGWLMLCSAWARSKPILWAAAIPLAAGVMVSWFSLMHSFNLSSAWFWQHIVVRMLFSVFPGGWIQSDKLAISSSSVHGLNLANNFNRIISVGNAWSQILSTEFLVGAAAGLAMITAAIWFRRRRDDA